MKIPEGYQRIMPYLIVEGASDFLNFMTAVFGAKEKMKEMRDETTIRHAEIFIQESTIMFADSTHQYPPQTAGLFIYVDNADATYDRALAKGAVSVLEPTDQEYGRTSGVKDPWGNTWWITSVKTAANA